MAAPDEEPAVRVNGLTKKYRSGADELVILANLDFEVQPGERLALIGESGAGKTTLLHLLGGLDHPTSGGIQIAGIDITSLGQAALADFRNRTLGFIWQTPSLLPEFSALENVMMPLLIRGLAPDTAARDARRLLDEVGLGARAGHRPGELSGGEQQRVVLARAFVTSPKVVLADEPTGSLDAKTAQKIVALLFELHDKHRITSIYVTHNMSFARQCGGVLELEGGKVRRATMEEGSYV